MKICNTGNKKVLNIFLYLEFTIINILENPSIFLLRHIYTEALYRLVMF